MKTLTSRFLLWLTLPFVIGFAGCEKVANVEGDLQRLSEPFAIDEAANNGRAAQPAGSGAVPTAEPVDDHDGDEAPLSLLQARLIVRLDAILRSRTADPGGAAASSAQSTSAPPPPLQETESVHRLAIKAAALLQVAGGAGAPDIGEVTTSLPEPERTVVHQQAEATLTDLARSFEAAGLDGAIERIAQAEAGLAIFHDDLRSSMKVAAFLPKEPLALLPMPPPARLEAAIAGLEIRQRRLRELHVVSGDARIASDVQFVSEQIKRMIGIRDSAERRQFHAERGSLFKQIGEKKWAELTQTRSSRMEPQRAAIRHELEKRTGYREIRVTANGVRGPPEPVGDMLFASVRSYDIDPGAWMRNEARLQAMATELARLPEVPAALKQPPAGSYDLIAAQLSDDRLASFRETCARVQAGLPLETTSAYLFADKKAHLNEWSAALDRQAAQRGVPPGPRRLTSNEVARIVKIYSPPPELPNRLAESEFLQLTDYRFPRREMMPHGLRKDVADILTRAMGESLEGTTELVREYREVSDRLARSVEKAPAELVERYKTSKASLQAVAFHFERAIAQAETFQADVSALRAQHRQLLALLPREPGWQPPAPPTQEATLRLRRYQPGLEKALQHLRSFIDDARPRLKETTEMAANLDDRPRSFAAEKGRLTITEAKLLEGSQVLASMKPDESKRRLPTDWEGRLNKEGRPYPFDEVKVPKRFESLGGGIHFGEVATPAEPRDFKLATLVFEPETGLLLRDSASGKQWVIAGKEVHPTTLKALYRFALSGRNAAVSIGWGTERESVADLLERKGESTVLLDPYLVDTAVGQDLVLADLVPWKLDKPALPNGNPVPFQKSFGKLLDDYIAPARQTLKSFVASVAPYRTEDREEWIAKIHHANLVLAPIVEAALQADALDETAFDSFVELEKTAVRAELERRYGGEIQRDPALARKFHWATLSATRRAQLLAEIASSIIEEQATELKADCRIRWNLLPKSVEKARQTMLELTLISTMSKPGTPNRSAVEWWVAIQRAENEPEEKIVATLLAYSNPVTLAALHDDNVVFTLSDDGKFSFSTSLKYFYGTSFVDASTSHVGATHSPDDASTEVKGLPELSNLVNANIDLLIQSYPPLDRIRRYAGIAAFFRWAVKAQAAGELALIDLGALGSYPANDRANFPTPDSLQR